eukprot:9486729-Pyramimonas_sp.AAC.1
MGTKLPREPSIRALSFWYMKKYVMMPNRTCNNVKLHRREGGANCSRVHAPAKRSPKLAV